MRPPGYRPCEGCTEGAAFPTSTQLHPPAAGVPARSPKADRDMDYQYIATPGALRDAIARLQRFPVIGVDTEAAGYHRYLDRISLIQISSPDENLLIDPIALEDLSSLGMVVSDSKIEKIFHDADYDL